MNDPGWYRFAGFVTGAVFWWGDAPGWVWALMGGLMLANALIPHRKARR